VYQDQVTSFRQFKRAVFKVDEEAAIICISDSEEIEDYCTQSERLRKDKEDDTFSDILKVGVKRAAVVVTMGV
jgi:hypothetical protein